MQIVNMEQELKGWNRRTVTKLESRRGYLQDKRKHFSFLSFEQENKIRQRKIILHFTIISLLSFFKAEKSEIDKGKQNFCVIWPISSLYLQKFFFQTYGQKRYLLGWSQKWMEECV
jgi:hypothetical protein